MLENYKTLRIIKINLRSYRAIFTSSIYCFSHDASYYLLLSINGASWCSSHRWRFILRHFFLLLFCLTLWSYVLCLFYSNHFSSSVSSLLTRVLPISVLLTLEQVVMINHSDKCGLNKVRSQTSLSVSLSLFLSLPLTLFVSLFLSLSLSLSSSHSLCLSLPLTLFVSHPLSMFLSFFVSVDLAPGACPTIFMNRIKLRRSPLMLS